MHTYLHHFILHSENRFVLSVLLQKSLLVRVRVRALYSRRFPPHVSIIDHDKLSLSIRLIGRYRCQACGLCSCYCCSLLSYVYKRSESAARALQLRLQCPLPPPISIAASQGQTSILKDVLLIILSPSLRAPLSKCPKI